MLLPMRLLCSGGRSGFATAILGRNNPLLRTTAALIALLAVTARALANIPGGGTGTGPDVTLVDNGPSVTIANGIVSILCTKAGATIDQINYTYNNGGGTQTINLLSGGNNGGQLYWELGGFGGGTFTYSVTADPASNGGNYAEISLVSSSASSGTMEVRFSMLRGSTGFYVTPIWSHRNTDAVLSMGETRDNIYAGSIFNWMSVDATRNRLMEVSGGSAIAVQGAPQEVSLWTSGIYQGMYEDKYKYTCDFGEIRAWGWSSVGAGGKNVGLWNVSASVEYYNGGPMKRELFEHIGTTILNMTHGSHFGGGTDSTWAANEPWTHVYGPYFIYCNNISNTITATNTAAQTLYADALAQGVAEQTAWPYGWFTNVSAYAQASSRGLVTGQILINDTYNPNASESNLWVGVVQQPLTSNGSYDFQDWVKPYQFWAKTDANGRFVISNVIAGANYTLYAFGQGAAGTFQSQAQSGGSAPNSVDIPTPSFAVAVSTGVTNDLGTVTWTPTRIGPTVFEIGYPDRTSRKFRHGEDWWVGDIGPSPSNPSPIWSKFLEYPFDFPNEPHYTVGQSRWTTDWNFVQPVVTDAAGNYNGSTSTITFNLASVPGATASLYIALSSDYQGPLIVQVNGNNLAGTNGYFPAYSSSSDQSDSTIREGIHGMYSDARFTFSGSLLQLGQNTITINMRKGGYFANHAMYDYIRLEMQGYIPPAPASAAAYSGNNCNLVCWPLTPGATSYNVLRSTTPGSGYVSITNGVTGSVCGSGWNNATFVDTTAVNGTTYYYVVQSVNPVGASTNSPQSAGTTPSLILSGSPPAAPIGLAAASAGHQTVSLNWSAPSGANFYTIYRSTLFNNGGGASNVLGTIVLANNVTGTSYTDGSPTDGSIYSYAVTATSAAGTSGNSAPAVAVPLPAPPASAPANLAGSFVQNTNILLTWSPVPGAVGYIVRRATSPGGPFVFQMSVTETDYLDDGLDVTATYYYQVAAMNAAGVSANATVTVISPPLAPTSLSAVPGNAQVGLSWPAVPNATAYWLFRGTSSNNEDTLVIANYAGTSYTDTGVVNGTTYYYVVAGTNSVGLGPDSPEAYVTPSSSVVFTPRNLTWRGDGSPNLWDVSGADNWVTNNVLTIFNNGDSVTFDNSGSNNSPITLAGALQPGLVTYNASKSYNFSGAGAITGTNALVKTGAGTLTINTTNTYSAGTILSNGTTICGNIGANATALGTGSITFDGGTLEFNGWTGSNGTDYGGNTNPLVVPTNQTGTIHVPQRFLSPGLAGNLSGNGTLNVQVKYVRGDIPGDWSAFTGKINVTYGSGGATVDDFRVANAAGWPNAKLNVGTNVSMYSRATANSTIPIGEFSAAAGSLVSADGGSGLGGHNAVTWRVGGLNTDATNAASFSGIVALVKEGTGTWTLTGASTHTGSTVVSNGTMLLNGSFNGSPITVNGGALGGVGTIAGAPVAVNSGGFTPGNPSGTGILTISNNVTLAGGTTSFMKVQHSPLTNNATVISGTISENGTLNVSNSGAAAFVAGDHFKLFNAASYSGSFASYILPSLNAGLRWDTSRLNVDGTLWVVSTSSPLISQATATANGFVLNGTGGTPNWSYYVLTATNVTQPTTQWTRAATNNFSPAGTFIYTNTINPAVPQLFLRIQVQ
jgi:autotransporter-associated beta strand protein